MAKGSSIRFNTFPRTTPPPSFVERIAEVFRSKEATIGTELLTKGLRSDKVLAVLRPGLEDLGFEVERGKRKVDKIERPVLFGEGGIPTVRYEIDAFHQEWQCGLEVEAGRAWQGNAVYRDLIITSLMANVEHFVLAVPNAYRYRSGGRAIVGPDYKKTSDLSETIYGHRRLALPYGLTVLGY